MWSLILRWHNITSPFQLLHTECLQARHALYYISYFQMENTKHCKANKSKSMRTLEVILRLELINQSLFGWPKSSWSNPRGRTTQAEPPRPLSASFPKRAKAIASTEHHFRQPSCHLTQQVQFLCFTESSALLESRSQWGLRQASKPAQSQHMVRAFPTRPEVLELSAPITRTRGMRPRNCWTGFSTARRQIRCMFDRTLDH